jgi:hypothetical protein
MDNQCVMIRIAALLLIAIIIDASAVNISYIRRDADVRVIVGSHRIVADILVVPSNRRVYILAIVPIHESSQDLAGFECGGIDRNGMIQLAALIQSIRDINQLNILPDGIEIGLIAIDSCGSDVRTIADLYELLAGVERDAIVAVIRIDSTSMPNFDALIRYLRLPTIGTYLSSASPHQKYPLQVSTAPNVHHLIATIIDLLTHLHIDCVSVLFNGAGYGRSAMAFGQSAKENRICVNEKVTFSSVDEAQLAIRKLLLSEARIVVVFASERTCK